MFKQNLLYIETCILSNDFPRQSGYSLQVRWINL